MCIRDRTGRAGIEPMAEAWSPAAFRRIFAFVIQVQESAVDEGVDVYKRQGRDHATDVSIRVITDHIRSTVFMVSDGILPSRCV